MSSTSHLLPLRELAQVVRSKNAGPTLLTLDLFMRDEAAYERAGGLSGDASGIIRKTGHPCHRAGSCSAASSCCSALPR